MIEFSYESGFTKVEISEKGTNPPDCLNLDNRVFDNFMLPDEPFAKAFRSLKIYVLVNKSLCEKLISSLESPTTFDERFFSKLLQYS